MSSLKPIKLYAHASGPNPWKVVIILLELGVPYEVEYVDFGVIKQEPYISVNPNGRVPAIEDPNTGITLWESATIIEYLEEQYDKQNKLQYTSQNERFQTSTWKSFQISGQGPYFGQFAWFSFYHPEKNLTSAIARYKNEILRVISVIDLHLSKSGKPYLVGDKCTYADLMFVPWNDIGRLAPDLLDEIKEKYPRFFEWNENLRSRDSVKEMLKLKAEAVSKH